MKTYKGLYLAGVQALIERLLQIASISLLRGAWIGSMIAFHMYYLAIEMGEDYAYIVI
jgi:hypothetical protein